MTNVHLCQRSCLKSLGAADGAQRFQKMVKNSRSGLHGGLLSRDRRLPELFDQLLQDKAFARASAATKHGDGVDGGEQGIKCPALLIVQFWIRRTRIRNQRPGITNAVFCGLNDFPFAQQNFAQRHFARTFGIRSNLRRSHEDAEAFTGRLTNLRQDIAARQDTSGDKFSIELDGQTLDNRGHCRGIDCSPRRENQKPFRRRRAGWPFCGLRFVPAPHLSTTTSK